MVLSLTSSAGRSLRIRLAYVILYLFDASAIYNVNKACYMYSCMLSSCHIHAVEDVPYCGLVHILTRPINDLYIRAVLEIATFNQISY